MRILVLRGGALGDFIVTLPTLAALRAHWPSARIELVGNTTAAALAVESHLIDEAHSQHESRWSALYSAEPLPPALGSWLASFDIVLNYWADPDRQFARHFPLRDGQQFLTADPQPTRAPAASHFSAPLRQLGITTPGITHELRTWRPDRSRIAVHPGSGSVSKNWPLSRWRDLCVQINAVPSANFVVISGEAEPSGLLNNLGPSLRQLPLNALADELSRCRLYLGHDTGVSHLAAACGTPCMLLFGPTDPTIWAPPGAHVHVVRRGTRISSITVGDALKTVHAILQDQR